MSAFFASWPFLWAQAQRQRLPPLIRRWRSRDKRASRCCGFSSRATPASARGILVGGILTWIKAISLICLVCWVVSWLIIGVKAAVVAQGHWYDFWAWPA